MITKESDSSGMKVWVTPLGKPPGMTEVIVEGERNSERTVGEQDNEYQPVTVIPAAASKGIVCPTNHPLSSFLSEREAHMSRGRAAPQTCGEVYVRSGGPEKPCWYASQMSLPKNLLS